MKKRGISVLFAVGVFFFLQACAIAGFQFPSAEYPANLEPMHLYVRQLEITQAVNALVGSLVGCVGCWMLALYLRTKRLEREINERLEANGPASN